MKLRNFQPVVCPPFVHVHEHVYVHDYVGFRFSPPDTTKFLT